MTQISPTHTFGGVSSPPCFFPFSTLFLAPTPFFLLSLVQDLQPWQEGWE